MTKWHFPPKEVYLTPHCEKCMNEPWEMEILWSEHDHGEKCDECDRGCIRYVLDKRCLRKGEK